MAPSPTLNAFVQRVQEQVKRVPIFTKTGKVLRVTGLLVEAEGPQVSVGELCQIQSQRGGSWLAEVVGFREERVLLMPYDAQVGMHPGCTVTPASSLGMVPAGMELIGRVLNALGEPIDGKGPLQTKAAVPLRRDPPHPLRRARVNETLATGVRVIDTFVPLARGQRLGIFAGSGVGKSTLLGMIARYTEAEVNVICLVGERGRELREFVECELGPSGLARSVVVVATSDQSALLRIRAALFATAVAEGFRDAGKDVLLMMDSVTRFAMAQREVGLAAGEPPASRGYPPSVFAMLPQLLERSGMGERGAITALYTVLVEGGDFDEPVADAVRGILDGHLLLSRELASANHFPAVDVLESVSRLSSVICSPEERALVGRARDLMATYRQHADLISIGAYVKGSQPHVDLAMEKQPRLKQFLCQAVTECSTRAKAFGGLAETLS